MKKVCIELKNGDKINLNLLDEYAPISVANFLHLVDIKFYDDMIFHRIIKGFMSQGGGYCLKDNTVTEKEVGYSIPGEFYRNGFANNVLDHEAGVISMARTSNPNSGAGQFFICDAHAPHLNGEYAAFGITADEESLTNVHKLSAIPTRDIGSGLTDFPAVATFDDVTIKTVYRLED